MISYTDSDKKIIELTSFSQLIAVAVSGGDDGVYSIKNDKINLYFMLKGFSDFLETSSAVLIGFTGARKNRGLENGPSFSFSGIAESLKTPLIAIHDPSLMLDDKLTLGWYLGNKYCLDYVNLIAGFLNAFQQSSKKKLIFSGGSGGGFAALNFANKMSDKSASMALVWNPQIILKNYNKKAVRKYIESCFEKSGNMIDSKVSFCGAKSIILMDGHDSVHLRLHLRDYLKSQGPPVRNKHYYIYGDSTSVLVGDWGEGHTPPPRWFIRNQLDQAIKNWHDLFSYQGLENKKKLPLDFSFEQVRKKFLSLLKVEVVNIEDHISISTNIEKFFVGFQLRYKIFDSSNSLMYFSPYLKIKQGCTVYAKVESDKLSTLNQWSLVVVVEDFHGVEKSLSFPFLKVINHRNYMVPVKKSPAEK